MKKSNWKTTTLGILSIGIAVASAAKTYLATGNLPDIGMLAASLAAAWGLVVAKDADSRI